MVPLVMESSSSKHSLLGSEVSSQAKVYIRDQRIL